jgi:hypothetical protein
VFASRAEARAVIGRWQRDTKSCTTAPGPRAAGVAAGSVASMPSCAVAHQFSRGRSFETEVWAPKRNRRRTPLHPVQGRLTRRFESLSHTERNREKRAISSLRKAGTLMDCSLGLWCTVALTDTTVVGVSSPGGLRRSWT